MKLSKLIALMILSLALTIPSNAGPDDLEYFNQFLYEVERDDTDPDFPHVQYRFLMPGFTTIDLDDGRVMAPDTNVLLFGDGTFKMKFKIWYKQDSGALFPGPCELFEGQWSVPETDLVLEGVGTAVRHFENQQHMIKLTFQEGFMEGLDGKELVYSHGYSNVGEEQAYRCFPF